MANDEKKHAPGKQSVLQGRVSGIGVNYTFNKTQPRLTHRQLLSITCLHPPQSGHIHETGCSATYRLTPSLFPDRKTQVNGEVKPETGD